MSDMDQARRAVALGVAREALLPQRGAFQGTSGPDAMDLVNVARWVETGQDPWADLNGPWVEIGGQRMTQAQFDAARFPLLQPDPGPAEPLS